MRTIINGNSVPLKWFFIDAVTGTDFDFNHAEVKLTLYSCNYKKELGCSINGNVLETTLPSYLPVGVYSMECTYWIGLGAKRANVIIHEAFQVSRNTAVQPIVNELELTSIATPIFTTKIATVEYVTEKRYKELDASESLGRRTIYVVKSESGAETMYLYNKELGGETYLPDEEDITLAEKTEEVENEFGELVEQTSMVYKFKDRDTNKGKGYIILRTEKSLVEQMVQENTIYEVRYDFDLGGGTLEVPANCVLEFKGGSLKNGLLVGNNTVIDAKPYTIFESIEIQGLFNVNNVYAEWFAEESDMDNIKAALDGFGKVNLLNKTYYCDKEISVNNVSYIKGDGATIKSISATQYKLKIHNSEKLEVSGISFDSDMISRGALHIIDCGDIFVTDCTFKNHAQLEDYYQTDGQLVTDTYNRLKVYGCTFENIGKDISVRDNLIRCISDQNGQSSVIESCKFINANQGIVGYTPNSVISKCYFCNIIHNGIYAFKKNLTVVDNMFNTVVQPVTYCDIEGLTIDSNCLIASNIFINSANRVVRINGDINVLKISNNIMECDNAQGSLLVAVAHDYLNTVNHVVIQGNRIDYTKASFAFDYTYSFISFAGNYALGDVVIKDNQLKNCWRSKDYVITYESSTVSGATNGRLILVDNTIESTNEECVLENFKRAPVYIKYNNYYAKVKTRITEFENGEIPNTGYDFIGFPRSFKFANSYPTQYFVQNNPYKAGDIIFPATIDDDTDFGRRVHVASDGTKSLRPMANAVMYDISEYFANGITGKAFILKMSGKYLLYIDAVTNSDVSNYGYLLYNIPSYIYKKTNGYVHIEGGFYLGFTDQGIQISRYNSIIPSGSIIRTTSPIVINIGSSSTSSAQVGPTKNRPSNVSVGTVFFDTVLGKPVWHKGDNVWVDATGTSV